MSMPFYVSPEQVMTEKADFARKGVGRGRSSVTLECAEGVLLMAENPSSLSKIGEIYDRIAFAGVGKYNEYDQLRVAGVRAADLKGYQYSRDDVDARSLANSYAQMLGQIFTHEMKPMEVEILICEVAHEPGDDKLFHILYDGTVMDERRFSVLGGDAEAISGRLHDSWHEDLTLTDALKAGVAALAGPDRTLGADDLEVAILCRTSARRCFQRLNDDTVAEHLASGAAIAAGDAPATEPTSETGAADEAGA